MAPAAADSFADSDSITVVAVPDGAAKADVELVAGTAVYNLERAQAVLDTLESKPTWEAADTESFDCMHYLGDEAIVSAAASLGLTRPVQDSSGSSAPAKKIIDVASGFGVTGRYLNRHFGAHVTGVELQAGTHAIAQTINYRAGLFPDARSVHKDFLELSLDEDLGAPFDGAVSILPVLHFPEPTPPALFAKLAECLVPGTGRLYIEDMFALRKTPDKKRLPCEHLPTKAEYVARLEGAGFGDIVFDDSVTGQWAEFVRARTVECRDTPDHDERLLAFYDALDGIFAEGAVGGVRISATLRAR